MDPHRLRCEHYFDGDPAAGGPAACDDEAFVDVFVDAAPCGSFAAPFAVVSAAAVSFCGFLPLSLSAGGDEAAGAAAAGSAFWLSLSALVAASSCFFFRSASSSASLLRSASACLATLSYVATANATSITTTPAFAGGAGVVGDACDPFVEGRWEPEGSIASAALGTNEFPRQGFGLWYKVPFVACAAAGWRPEIEEGTWVVAAPAFAVSLASSAHAWPDWARASRRAGVSKEELADSHEATVSSNIMCA